MGLLLCNSNLSLIGILIVIVSPPDPEDPPLQRIRIFHKRLILFYTKIKDSRIGFLKPRSSGL